VPSSRPNRPCGPPSLMFMGYWGSLPREGRDWDARLTTHLRLVPRPGISGALPPLPSVCYAVYRDNFAFFNRLQVLLSDKHKYTGTVFVVINVSYSHYFLTLPYSCRNFLTFFRTDVTQHFQNLWSLKNKPRPSEYIMSFQFSLAKETVPAASINQFTCRKSQGTVDKLIN